MVDADVPLPPHKLPRLPPIAREPPSPADAWTSFLFGLRIGRERLLRRRVALLGVLALSLAISGAIIERRVGAAGAVDRALETTFRLLLPLVTFALVAEASAHVRLRDAAWSAARYGGNHRDVVLGVIAAALAASALFAAVLAACSVVVAHSPSAPPLVGDMLTSAWIAAATAVAYVGWFSLGSTFLKLGRGRVWVLVADFVIGGSAGLAGAILPRGNAANLLGGRAPLDLSQRASAALLVATACALCVAAVMRSRR